MKISCDRIGTHSMQCLIEILNMPEEEKLLQEMIEGNIMDLAKDANGTHVLQKVLLCMKEENAQYIIQPSLENLCELSFN